MEYDIDSTEAWFLERAKRKTPKRLKAVDVIVKPKRTAGPGNSYKNTKTGYREDIGITVRSGWEADFLRILTSYNIKYEYEPYVFPFPVKVGIKGYTPDIYFPVDDSYVEIKGYFDSRSRIKIKRFKKYYPLEFSQLTIVINKFSKEALQISRDLEIPDILFFQDIVKIFKSKISNWETY